MENVEYKGHKIEIILDEDAKNPFEAWDCEAPLAVSYERDITSYAKQYGNVNEVPTLSREQIKANLPAILLLLDIKNLFEVRQYKGDTQYSYDLTECVNYALGNAIDDLGDSDRLEALCELYNMAGIPAICKASRGYCQGDYALVLAVATPEFQKACGNAADYDWFSNLESAVKLWGYWAWGTVYGYRVRSTGDSCFGYYGYPEDSGLLDDAKASIDYHIEQERKAHFEQVKTWIKNRVPLQYRVTA